MNIQLSEHFTYRKLLRFAFPSICMMVFTSIYSIVDGYFVSNYAGKTSFAAVNFIMPFLCVLGAVGFMIGSGGCALIGKKLGEDKKEEANGIFSMLVYLTLALSVVIAVIGFVFMKDVAILLGADEPLAELCARYGRIIIAGLPPLMLQFEFQSFFVVAEKPNLGFAMSLIAGVANIIGDFVLVGLLGLDLEGAAWATFASQVAGGILPLIYFSRKNNSLLRLGKPQFSGADIAQTFLNGSSEFVSNISMSIVGMLYNAQLLRFAGEDGVSAYGVLMYVGFIFVAIFIGYAVGTAPIVSFHYGAGNKAELKSLLRKSLAIMMSFAVVMFLAGELLSAPFSRLFVGYDDGLLALTKRAFLIYSFSFLFCAVPIYGSSFFTALNNGPISAAISFLRTMLCQVGAVLLMPMIWGIDGIWASVVVAEIVAAAVTVAFWVGKRNKYGY